MTAGVNAPHNTKAATGIDARVLTELVSPALATRMQVHGSIDSTQQVLLDTASRCADRSWVVSTHQRAGRGRRGRRWVTPPDSALALSMLAHQPPTGRWQSAVSLALGVAVAEVVASLGAPAVQVKWPNDVWVQGRKLGGILVESYAGGVVAGVGVNWQLDGAARALIDQPCIDLFDLGVSVSPEFLAAALAEAWNETFDRFARHGWAAFEERWIGLDALSGKSVRLWTGAHEPLEGVACGVDARGALQVDIAGQLRHFSSAEVSVRTS